MWILYITIAEFSSFQKETVTAKILDYVTDSYHNELHIIPDMPRSLKKGYWPHAPDQTKSEVWQRPSKPRIDR